MNLKAALIQLPKRNDTCGHCQERLNNEDNHYSMLLDNDSENRKNEEFVRRDYCAPCWKKFPHDKARGYWKSAIPQKNQVSKAPQTREKAAYELLKESFKGKENDSGLTNEEAFFLGLYLVRRGLLSLKKEIVQGNVSYQLFEVNETQELIAIKRINLQKIDTSNIQSSLSQKIAEREAE